MRYAYNGDSCTRKNVSYGTEVLSNSVPNFREYTHGTSNMFSALFSTSI